jgi:hypothetical protein
MLYSLRFDLTSLHPDSGRLYFEPADGCAEPTLNRLLRLGLVLLPLQLVDGCSGCVERDVMARHIFYSGFRRNEVNQQAFAARMRPCRVAQIEAAWRILKARSRLPRRLN